MRVAHTVAQARTAREEMTGEVGLVPTMGALHAGHEALIRRSRAECDHTAVTIFVNPTQFNDGADLAAYPRDLERDLALVSGLGADLVWTPPPEEVYPAGYQTFVEVRELAQSPEGAARAGHFTGVATVVTKLLLLFQPQRAYFGRKDPQQLALVRRLAVDLDLPVTIVGCATVRAADGVALSSRNVLLNATARSRATVLYHGLARALEAWRAGERRRAALLECTRGPIEAAGIELEYLSLADPDTLCELGPVAADHDRVLVSLAARVDGVRLIDSVTLPDDLFLDAGHALTGRLTGSDAVVAAHGHQQSLRGSREAS